MDDLERRLWTVGELDRLLRQHMPESTVEFTDTKIVIHPAPIPVGDSFDWNAAWHAVDRAWADHGR